MLLCDGSVLGLMGGDVISDGGGGGSWEPMGRKRLLLQLGYQSGQYNGCQNVASDHDLTCQAGRKPGRLVSSWPWGRCGGVVGLWPGEEAWGAREAGHHWALFVRTM